MPDDSTEGWEWRPLTASVWDDFERLFGRSGAYGGCWCMWFRQSGREYQASRGAGNRQAMCGLVVAGTVPGVLLYRHAQPAGWVSLQPREAFPRLDRSRAAKRVDDARVWSVVCFFVGRQFRGQGAMGRLIEAAIEHARACGATLLEAYPKDLEELTPTADAAYVGLLPAFLATGFVEVARHAKGRPIVRLALG